MAKLLKMEDGDYAWSAMGIEQELDNWQAYNFMTNEWMPAEDLMVYGDADCLSQESFDSTIAQILTELPDDATVCIYEGNWSYGALRNSRVA